MSRSPAFEPTRELPPGDPVSRVDSANSANSEKPAKSAKPARRRGGAVFGSGLVMLGFGGGLAIGGGLLLVSLGILGVALWASPSGTQPITMAPAPIQVVAASDGADVAAADVAAADVAAADVAAAEVASAEAADLGSKPAVQSTAPAGGGAAGEGPPGGPTAGDPSSAAPALAAAGTADDEGSGWGDSFSNAVRGIGVAVGLIDDTEIVPPTEGGAPMGEGIDGDAVADASEPKGGRSGSGGAATNRRAPQGGSTGGAAVTDDGAPGTADVAADKMGEMSDADALIADLVADRDDPAARAMDEMGTAKGTPMAAAPGLVGGTAPPTVDTSAPGGEFAMPAGVTTAGADRVDDLPTRGGWAESAMSLVDAGMRLMTGSAATDRAPVAPGTAVPSDPSTASPASTARAGQGTDGADLLAGDDEDWGFEGGGTRPGEGEPDPEVLAMLAEADAVGRDAPPATGVAADDEDEWAAFDAVADAVGLRGTEPTMAPGTGDDLDDLVAGLGTERSPMGDARGAPNVDLLADDEMGGFEADGALLEDEEADAEIMAMLAEADAVPRQAAPPPPAQAPPNIGGGSSSWADSARSLVSAGMSMMMGTSGSAPAPTVAQATPSPAAPRVPDRDLLAGEDDMGFEVDAELYEDDVMDDTVASILADADAVERGSAPDIDDVPMTEDEWTAPIPGVGRGAPPAMAAQETGSAPPVDDGLAIDADEDADELLADLLSERDEFDVAPDPAADAMGSLAMGSAPEAASDWDDGAAAVVDTAAPAVAAPPPPPPPKQKPEDLGSDGWSSAATSLVRSGMAMMTGNSESAGASGGGSACVGELCEDDDLANYRDGQSSGRPVIGTEDYNGMEVEDSDPSDVAELFNVPGGADEPDAGALADLDGLSTYVVQVNADVEGIEVRIDGALLGITPALISVKPGWHVVQLGTGDTLRAEAVVDPDEWCFENKGKNFKQVRCR